MWENISGALLYLLAQLASIPAAFWGVVVGSFFSLGGTILANRANDRRLRIQFEQDLQVRRKDREQSLRREIYLAAVEAVSAGLHSISRFADLNVPDDKLIEPFTEKAPAIAKIQVIATTRTAKAIGQLGIELNSSFLRLYAKRVRLSIINQKIAVLDALVAGFSKTIDQMTELMRQYNLEGAQDPKRWGTLDGYLKFEQGRVANTNAERFALMQSRTSLQVELTKESFASVRALTPLILPALFAIRNELETATDEAELSKLLTDSLKTQQAEASNFLDDLQSLMNQEIAVAKK